MPLNKVRQRRRKITYRISPSLSLSKRANNLSMFVSQKQDEEIDRTPSFIGTIFLLLMDLLFFWIWTSSGLYWCLSQGRVRFNH